ncbi:hypothetical protein HMPREF9996_01599 [Aggregatibacter actinomycetemcomitans Y4]|nr:hypothetical protein HMPREF9996_01599 [Aggregatibacter actinomycetemcomitans Y4]
MHAGEAGETLNIRLGENAQLVLVDGIITRTGFFPIQKCQTDVEIFL